MLPIIFTLLAIVIIILIIPVFTDEDTDRTPLYIILVIYFGLLLLSPLILTM